MKLTPKQEKFAQEYVRTSNASEAYRQAYNAENSTPKSINENASRLLADVKVASRVSEIRQSIAEKAEMDIADWIKEVRRLLAAMKSVSSVPLACAAILKDHLVARNPPGSRKIVPLAAKAVASDVWTTFPSA